MESTDGLVTILSECGPQQGMSQSYIDNPEVLYGMDWTGRPVQRLLQDKHFSNQRLSLMSMKLMAIITWCKLI